MLYKTYNKSILAIYLAIIAIYCIIIKVFSMLTINIEHEKAFVWKFVIVRSERVGIISKA